MVQRRLGVWLIGACGGVATTSLVGATALRRGLAQPQGLVSELPQFAQLDLVPWDALVFGGHEIRQTTLVAEAAKLHQSSRVIDQQLLDQCQSDLEAVDGRIRPGTLWNVGATIQQIAAPKLRELHESPRQILERLSQDLQRFQSDQQLDQVIVVNVASTEPPVEASGWPAQWSELSKLLDDPQRCPLAASSLYAIAALQQGYPYLNFTPSLGSAPAAICELALQHETCHMGHDGKTGETLLKSVLAPMFAQRNLDVMSWVGHNIFGNLDGKVLDDPVNKRSKVVSKDRLLGQILGYHPQTLVSIEYIESMGDWKTAWDHIHFRGFLGTPMVMQFIWQGCDSLLAAPLVLDLIRFTDCAQRRGERGLLKFLASFFKSPLGVEEHDFTRQFQMLEQWAESVERQAEG